MRTLTVEAVLGATADVHACLACRAFWFEPYETLHLTRASTLNLFKMIADQTVQAGPFPKMSYCPICNARLLLTHDRQQNTSFQYWRCEAGHGRFTSFTDFLREKDFIRPLTPLQIAELRKSIQMINCANCGAPIDLGKDSACPHCGAPLSILDAKKMMAAGSPTPTAQPPAHPHSDVNSLLASHGLPPLRHETSAVDLIEHGLATIAQWLRTSAE